MYNSHNNLGEKKGKESYGVWITCFSPTPLLSSLPVFNIFSFYGSYKTKEIQADIRYPSIHTTNIF